MRVSARVAGSVAAACLVSIVPWSPVPAFAQSTEPPPESTRLFNEGRQCNKQKNFVCACERLEASQRMHSSVGTLLNLSICKQELGKLDEALVHARQARSMLAPDDERVPLADAQIAAVLQSIRTTSDAGTDGSLGTSTMGATDAGGANAKATDSAAPLADAVPPPVDAMDGSVSQGKGPPSVSSTSGYKTWGYVIGSIGIVSIGVGVASGVLAIQAATRVSNHCDANRTCDPVGLDAAATGRTVQLLSPITLAIGLAAVGVSGYLFFLAPKGGGRGTLSPQFFPGGGGMSYSGEL